MFHRLVIGLLAIACVTTAMASEVHASLQLSLVVVAPSPNTSQIHLTCTGNTCTATEAHAPAQPTYRLDASRAAGQPVVTVYY